MKPSTNPSRNLAQPDPTLTFGLDKRYTGRNIRISLAVKPEFAAELKRTAALKWLLPNRIIGKSLRML